tara:strand:+ start:439 stop:1167 length:729 start_codon:yes stop_codon:yes gene_type:complete
MQQRYLGDVHDFIKLLYLKILSKKLNKVIGLNWYLVKTEILGNTEKKLNDGEKRDYLKSSYFKSLDLDIFRELIIFRNKENRVMDEFTKTTHLKNHIKFFNKHINLTNRNVWFDDSILHFKKNNIIFLDSDNGLAPKNMKLKSKKSLKYVYRDELKSMYDHQKTIIFTQFQSYNLNHKIYLRQKIDFIKNTIGLDVNCPIIRNRTSPNTFFITIAQKNHIQPLTNIILDFTAQHSFCEIVNY